MYDELPKYWGVGFFGEDIFSFEHTEDIDEDKLKSLYPKITSDW